MITIPGVHAFLDKAYECGILPRATCFSACVICARHGYHLEHVDHILDLKETNHLRRGDPIISDDDDEEVNDDSSAKYAALLIYGAKSQQDLHKLIPNENV